MLETQRIPFKFPKIITRLSVYFGGSWQFTSPMGEGVTQRGVYYFEIPYKFGILEQFQTNPSKTINRGEAGDYLVVRDQYSIMSRTKFDILFPTRITTPSAPPTRNSALLADPKFLEGIIQEYKTGSSYIPTGGGSVPSTGGGGY